MKNYNCQLHKIKTGVILLTMIFNFYPEIYAQVSFGESQLMNDDWYFILDNPENAQEADFNHEKWTRLDLPHDWSIEGLLSPSLWSCTGYLPGGIGWYRKTLDFSKLPENEKVFLYFEGEAPDVGAYEYGGINWKPGYQPQKALFYRMYMNEVRSTDAD